MKVSEQFHKAFKLQGKSFNSIEEILLFSHEVSVEVFSFLENWFNENLFIEVQTSGSTGTPKIIQLQKEHMIQSALATGNYFELAENTSALLCMSPNYIAGKMMLVRAITLGWHLDVVAPVSNPLKDCHKTYDFSAMVPLQLQSSLADMYKIKKLIVGGGAISNELLSEIQHIDTVVFATYGMTETITHIAVKKLNHFEKVISSVIEKSVYNLLPNISIATDERGCLVINAPKVSNEQIITNDLVEICSEKSFNWLGRFDSVINSGGIKLIPEQIEAKFSKIISQRFFVTGIKDAVFGEKLVLILELNNANTEKLKSELLKKIHQLHNVSKYEIPKEIYAVTAFAETETNKINRKETLKLIKSISKKF